MRREGGIGVEKILRAAGNGEDEGKQRRGESVGYYDGEHTKNVRDWKEVFDFAVENPIAFPVWNESGDLELRKLFNKWPENFPELR